MILREMNESDLHAVLRIEREVHSHPWTLGNFNDALRSGYQCKVFEASGVIVGFAVMMHALDEVELLDIAIDKAQQRKGIGRMLLQALLAMARQKNMRRMVLEVRASNQAAIALYHASGFGQIGLRRDYYVATNGREDAILMGKDL